MTSSRYRPSPAMLVACLALFVALGGTSYALAVNSIRSKHIVNGQVKRPDIRNNAVNSAKVANGSLLGADFAAGQLPAGPAGPAGPKGDAGAQGIQGVQGDPGMSGYERVNVFDPSQESATFESKTADCPAGKVVVGGGGDLDFEDRNVALSESRAIDDDTWQVTAVEVVETADTRFVDVFAVCVNVAP